MFFCVYREPTTLCAEDFWRRDLPIGIHDVQLRFVYSTRTCPPPTQVWQEADVQSQCATVTAARTAEPADILLVEALPPQKSSKPPPKPSQPTKYPPSSGPQSRLPRKGQPKKGLVEQNVL